MHDWYYKLLILGYTNGMMIDLNTQALIAEKRGELDLADTLKAINADNAKQERLDLHKIYVAKNASFSDEDF